MMLSWYCQCSNQINFKLASKNITPSPRPSTNPNQIPIPNATLSPKADQSIVNSRVGIMPVIFDTCDQVNAIVTEEQLCEKIDCFSDIQTKVDALNAISKICSIASVKQWTFKETMKQIDCTLLDLV